MCLLASATRLDFRGMPINILAQIGFVVLVGLAAKNAILIVEFRAATAGPGGRRARKAATAGRAFGRS
jgi:multidrug efflux pump subunit AcrB